MVRLVLLLLGVDYLRTRARAIFWIGVAWAVAGLVVFVDALDGAMHFPIALFAWLFLVEGLATLAVAWTGVGGQRVLRYVKGTVVVVASVLIFAGHHHGNFILSMIFGTLFLVDGLLQCVSAWLVRYRRWRVAFAWGSVEMLIALFFYQPYPTHYAGTLPYCLGLFLVFGGTNLMSLASRARQLVRNPALNRSRQSALWPDAGPADVARRFDRTEWDGPPADHERALTVHVWTPTGSSKAPAQHHPIVDRYIAAVDVNGTISTGHAALESPEGIYISLYPGVEIDRSPDEFGRILRATRENDVPGIFQPDYTTESKAWCPSTVRVRIRNYDPAKLAAFWERYRADTTYNLTHRNCSSTVAHALEAAIDGAVGRLRGDRAGWGSFVRVLVTPELWVAAQIRKRATTMAWTPGLTLDYARALSMLADPRPFAWWQAARLAAGRLTRQRRTWRVEDAKASRG
ncbi:HdeD family acid-resistance protein [Burkholderia pyrrocinia]|uniref:HdeD family acid-resistance protein n=1 Tax=Burkholderia pyrrocinia TaxID=60550 RepID=UPI0038B62298